MVFITCRLVQRSRSQHHRPLLHEEPPRAHARLSAWVDEDAAAPKTTRSSFAAMSPRSSSEASWGHAALSASTMTASISDAALPRFRPRSRGLARGRMRRNNHSGGGPSSPCSQVYSVAAIIEDAADQVVLGGGPACPCSGDWPQASPEPQNRAAGSQSKLSPGARVGGQPIGYEHVRSVALLPQELAHQPEG